MGRGQLEGDAGGEHRSDRPAEALAQALFAGIDEDDAVAGGQDADPDEGEAAELLLQEPVEPTVADPESELVVEGLGGRGEQSGGLAQEAHEAALVDEAHFLALDAGAIGFEDQRQEGLDAHQRQQGGEHPGDLAVVLREAEPLEGLADGGEEGQQRAEHQRRTARAEQPDALELRQSAGVLAEEEGHEAQPGEHGHGEGGGRGAGGHFGLQVLEEIERAAGLDQEQHEREPGHEPLLEEHARLPGGERLVGRRIKEGRLAARAGQFLHLQSLGLLGGLEAHLEPSHQGRHEPHQGEGRAQFGGRRIGDLGHHFEPDGQSQQGDPVQRSGLEGVSFHGRSGG